MSEGFFEIGSSRVSLRQIFDSPPPTNLELSTWCHTFGVMVGSGVPILQALPLAADATSHPWMVMITKMAEKGIREQGQMAVGIERGLKSLVKDRVRYLAAQLEDLPPEPEVRPTRQRPVGPVWPFPSFERDEGSKASSSTADDDREKSEVSVREMGYFVTKIVSKKSGGRLGTDKAGVGHVPFQSQNWRIPDFFGHFSMFLHMIEMGEQIGEFDSACRWLCDYYKFDVEAAAANCPWDTETHRALVSLSVLQNFGLPILRSLRIIAELPDHESVKPAIYRISDEVEGGSTLSEAFERSQSEFSDPVLVGLIKAGEAGGALEVILERIAGVKER